MNRAFGAGTWFVEQLERTGYITPEEALKLRNLERRARRETKRICQASIALERAKGLLTIRQARTEAIHRGDWRKWIALSCAAASLRFNYYRELYRLRS